MDKITVKKEVISKILDFFTYFDEELGGVLISLNNEVVDFYPLDNILLNKKNEYMFSFEQLNNVLEPYFKKGYDFIGIVHSHNGGMLTPSKNDKNFFTNLLKTNQDYQFLLFPIVSLNENKPQIKWWSFSLKDNLKEIEVEIK